VLVAFVLAPDDVQILVAEGFRTAHHGTDVPGIDESLDDGDDRPRPLGHDGLNAVEATFGEKRAEKFNDAARLQPAVAHPERVFGFRGRSTGLQQPLHFGFGVDVLSIYRGRFHQRTFGREGEGSGVRQEPGLMEP
jgi:hypothetical protein